MRLAVVMDPIGSINIKKDSTFAMILSAQKRGWEVCYLEQEDLLLSNGEAIARGRALTVFPDRKPWFELSPQAPGPLSGFDAVLMRKDPPVDAEYLYSTQILEFAERQGALVVNRPSSLRNFNEKLFAAQFPDLMPATLVTRRGEELRRFLEAHRDVVLKPLGGMGGQSIFRLRVGDANVGVTIEILTAQGTRYAMAQRFLPEIAEGDKRILMIDGEPVPYALARIPAEGETRGNLAAGGHGEGRPLTAADRTICARVGPVLREHGILFAGLDVIGTRLTEINITSPTCIRELDHLYNLDIAGQLLEVIEARVGVKGAKRRS